ncbi:hypothetical protein ACFO1V_14335 [Daeguia caeni]|uniref:Uncharacterized protein n=1 Tax=Daeguia caeni TaxID=439612 RepID=A0ABV9H9K3_9HYPH
MPKPDFWDYVFRLFRILFGMAIAFWLGTAFFVALNLGQTMREMEPQGGFDSGTFSFITVLFATPVTAMIVGQIAIYPILLAVVIAEIAGRKDALFYMLAGIAIGALMVGYGASHRIPFAENLFQSLVVICSCIVGMLVYWLIAGRGAGRFHRPVA